MQRTAYKITGAQVAQYALVWNRNDREFEYNQIIAFWSYFLQGYVANAQFMKPTCTFPYYHTFNFPYISSIINIQPRSVLSSDSASSTSSARRAKTRQYYTVSKTSNVDESLFGESNKTVRQRQQQNSSPTQEMGSPGARRGSPSASKTKKRREKQEIQVITKDLIRNLM